MNLMGTRERIGGRRSWCATAVVLAACLGGLAAGDAQARVVTCSPPTTRGSVGFILSARGMSCGQATSYYRRHNGDQHVPISAGQVTHIGTFTCLVYQDLTPPGPSDTWVRIRCANGARAFRLEYGV